MSVLVVVLLTVAFAFAVYRMKSVARPVLSPLEAAEAAASGNAVIVDVREPAEWAAGVAQPAVLLPLSDLKGPRVQWGPFLEGNRDRRIVVYCQSGMRSGMAASLLQSEGFRSENIGGFPRWVEAGLPVRIP